MTETEKCEWLTFKVVCLIFLGNLKAENYKELLADLLKSHQTVGCNMSFKIHSLHSHLDFSPPNLGAVGDDRGKCSTRILLPWNRDTKESSHRTFQLTIIGALLRMCLLSVTNEWATENSYKPEKNQTFIFIIFCVITWSYFNSVLTAIREFLIPFQHEKSYFKTSDPVTHL